MGAVVAIFRSIAYGEYRIVESLSATLGTFNDSTGEIRARDDAGSQISPDMDQSRIFLPLVPPSVEAILILRSNRRSS
jgi:hypothetical protein